MRTHVWSHSEDDYEGRKERHGDQLQISHSLAGSCGRRVSKSTGKLSLSDLLWRRYRKTKKALPERV